MENIFRPLTQTELDNRSIEEWADESDAWDEGELC